MLVCLSAAFCPIEGNAGLCGWCKAGISGSCEGSTFASFSGVGDFVRTRSTPNRQRQTASTTTTTPRMPQRRVLRCIQFFQNDHYCRKMMAITTPHNLIRRSDIERFDLGLPLSGRAFVLEHCPRDELSRNLAIGAHAHERTAGEDG